MEVGDAKVDVLLGELGKAARLPDRAAGIAMMQSIRHKALYGMCLSQPGETTDILLGVLNDNLGYITGYMPSEYGNIVLQGLGIKHPIFGDNLSVSVDEALAAGMQLVEEHRQVQLAAERKAKKAAKKAALGIDIPDVDDAVSSADAKTLLTVLRNGKAATVDTHFGVSLDEDEDGLILKLMNEDELE